MGRLNGCEGYGAIARVYDRLNAEIDYAAWADFIEKCFDRYLPARPELVLDLACGTGRMTRELSDRGYDMIGVDGSVDMLSQAWERSEGRQILYLQQDMREFELYGTVGAVTCCLDSLNYLLSEKDLDATLSLVHNYLDPDGLFVFDMNTPYKFENVYGDNAYILEDDGKEETEGVFCGWQNHFDPETGICDFDLSLFEANEDGTYSRTDEHQQEKCYDLATVRTRLESAGMEFLGAFSDFDFGEPDEKCERWYICARCKK